jgi:hypothetical protein
MASSSSSSSSSSSAHGPEALLGKMGAAGTPQEVIAIASGQTADAAATLKDTHKMWKQAGRRCHPDKHPGQEASWSKVMSLLNQAWQAVQAQPSADSAAAANGACSGVSAAHAAAAKYAERKRPPASHYQRWGAGASSWQEAGFPVSEPEHIRFFIGEDRDRRIYPASCEMEEIFQGLFSANYAPWIGGDWGDNPSPLEEPIDTQRLFRFLAHTRCCLRIQTLNDTSNLTVEIYQADDRLGTFIADMCAGKPSCNWKMGVRDAHNGDMGKHSVDAMWNRGNAGEGLLKELNILRVKHDVLGEYEDRYRAYVRMRIRNWLFRTSDSKEEKAAASTLLRNIRKRQPPVGKKKKKKKKKKRKRISGGGNTTNGGASPKRICNAHNSPAAAASVVQVIDLTLED